MSTYRANLKALWPNRKPTRIRKGPTMPTKVKPLTKAQHIDKITGIITTYAGELRDAVKLPNAKAITDDTKVALEAHLKKVLPNGVESKIEKGLYDDPKPANAFTIRVNLLGKWLRCGDADDFTATNRIVEDARKDYVEANDKRQKLCLYTDLKMARALAQQFYVRSLAHGTYSVSEIKKRFEAELKKSCTC